jgi:hypothetical protein
MKKIRVSIALIILLATSWSAKAQTINWKSFKENQNNVVNLNAGVENGFVFGLGYGYKLRIKQPVLLNVEFSTPTGKDLFDDFKTKLGGQVEVVKVSNFAATVKAYGIFRRYQSNLVTLANFGSEFSATIGYYKPKWYVAGVLGFDKAITTHIKNSSLMKDIYPDVQDGWYIPTGGNFLWNIQCGYSFKSNDLYLKAGKTITQDFETTASLPVYLQLGFNRRF